MKISTTKIGANTKQIVSNKFSIGNTAISNIFLKDGTNNTDNINAAEANIASISLLLLNGFVANNDFALFLTLNSCTSYENASTANAIV